MSKTLQGHCTKLNKKKTETPTVGSRGQTTVRYTVQYIHDRLIIVKRRPKRCSLRDMCGILANLLAGDGEAGVGGGCRDKATRRCPVCHIVDLHLVAGGQWIALHRAALVRQG